MSDLRKSRPDLVEFIESWEYVGQVGELDFSTEIDEPRLELDLPFVQVETPAEKELRAQIKQMQASLVTLQGCRRPGGLGK